MEENCLKEKKVCSIIKLKINEIYYTCICNLIHTCLQNCPNVKPEEPTLPVFGHWQTEPYIPPCAVDGKVPRNDYGNIELFKQCMLPGGTVHLRLPALNKVAKKLNIDCVSAMTGWDFHGGYNHPIMDGFVVCEEHKDILIAAWDEDQMITRQRDEEVSPSCR